MSLPSLQQQFQVSFSYPVHFTEGLFEVSNPLLRDVLAQDGGRAPRKVFFALDSGVAEQHPHLTSQIVRYVEAHADVLQLSGPVALIPGGEQCKNQPALVQQLLEAVDAHHIDRHSYLAAIGGGAVLDMVGYAASVAHRGVRHLRIPTTVLSQNDSGIGVKNSVNAFGKKNFLGNFAPPYAVFNDFAFLRTLEDRDWRGGIAEALKVSLIKDAAFFRFMQAHAAALAARELPLMQQLIHRCAELHLEHIAGGDAFEQGSSRPLDFGHWSAHKLEQLSHYRIRHGEAVAIGIALDSVYSHLQGRLTVAELAEIIAVLETLGFELYAPEMVEHLTDAGHPQSLLHGLQEFREHLGGQLTIMLLDGIGTGVEVHEIDDKLMVEAVHQLQRYSRGVRPSAPL
ncbi:3-dehydroquinate synthase [Hymenobacter roseosalivarius DSM 11622]|uniref:3-dehydroquinate synthase n=1 Tax=Hymenobacter roseosalivarius DSM 11622 TaxID=645990 RepID=A0A1W1W1U6_9BACT|nr:3-dehydroquinate synthase [Hymenobacter roseosalivarius]SMB99556.1 3-dehydroquinate synthase [Hymenobacter roseosalivarius DSM 11622]